MVNWEIISALVSDVSLYKNIYQETVEHPDYAMDVVDACREKTNLFFLLHQRVDEDFGSLEEGALVTVVCFADQAFGKSEETVLSEQILSKYGEWSLAKQEICQWVSDGSQTEFCAEFENLLVAYKANSVVEQIRTMEHDLVSKNTDLTSKDFSATGGTQSKRQNSVLEGQQLRKQVTDLALQMNFDQVYEVGGCIRSEMLGQKIKDIDVAVCGETAESLRKKLKKFGGCKPLEVAGSPIGYRLYTPWAKEGIEFALSRTEVSTGKGHHDFQIMPSPDISIEEDLLRRDFTVNAMARDMKTGQLIDPFGGKEDCKNKILRTVSPTSFRDDPLRMLRGLVRISKDNLRPDESTLQQMKDNASLFASKDRPVSKERIREELQKMLEGENVYAALSIARDTGVLQSALPIFTKAIGFDQESKYHDMTVDEHIFKVVENACKWKASEVVRIAALLHDIGKPDSAWRGQDGKLHYYKNFRDKNSPPAHEILGADMAREFWMDMGGDKKTQNQIVALVKHHMYNEDSDCADKLERKNTKEIKTLERSARRWLVKIQPAHPEDLLMLRRCDRAGKNADLAPDWDRDLKAWEQVVRSQMNKPLSIKSLAIDGHKIKSMGFEGKEIGSVLDQLLKNVLNNPQHNNAAQLEKWALAMKKEKNAKN